MTRRHCGCDAKAGWICDRHAGYLLEAETDRVAEAIRAAGAVDPVGELAKLTSGPARLKQALSELAEGITATGTRALSLEQIAERLQRLADAAEWQQLAELSAKERREFAWAEEYMAKSRMLELKLEAAEQQIATLTDELKRLKAYEHLAIQYHEQVATLTTEALMKYGRHAFGCSLHLGGGRKCTCGFDAALAAVRVAQKS